jgi:antitoxin HigA-1
MFTRPTGFCSLAAMPKAPPPPPTHPGEFLRLEVLPALSAAHQGQGLRVLADALHVPLDQLSRFEKGLNGVTPTLALKLARVLPTAGSAADWMARQAAYDLWKCEQALGAHVAVLEPLGKPQKRR